MKGARQLIDHVAFVSGGLIFGVVAGAVAYVWAWMYVALGLTLVEEPLPWAETIGFTGAAAIAVFVGVIVTAWATVIFYERDDELQGGGCSV